jgi:hypothetical protein
MGIKITPPPPKHPSGYEMEDGGFRPLQRWLDEDPSIQIELGMLDPLFSRRFYRDPNLPMPYSAIPVSPQLDAINDEFKGNYILRNWLKQ